MGSMIKWLAAAGLALALLVGNRPAVAAQRSAQPAADPAVWGIYAQLVGTTWRGEGSGIEWQWGPDNTIVETRPMFLKAVISQGSRPGELLQVYGPGLHTYDGWIAADGSVIWIRRGRFMKVPQRMALVDGRYREQRVKLDEADQVVKVTGTGWYDQTGGTALAGISKAVETVAPVAVDAAPPSAPAEPAPDAAELARRHAVNQRYWTALTRPTAAGKPRGRWWRVADQMMYLASGSGDRFIDTVWVLTADGRRVELKGSYVLDPERGTWTATNGDKVTVARATSTAEGEFKVEVLPEAGVTPAEADKMGYHAAFGPTTLTMRQPPQPVGTFDWLPEQEAIALFERAAADRAVAFAHERARLEAEQRAAAEAQRVAAERIMEQQRMYAEQNARQELLDAQADYEFELERQEKAARWAQTSAAAEQGLADSISRLNNTVASVEAQQAQYRAQQQAMQAQQEAAARVADAQRAREATGRQYEIARQNEAARQAQVRAAANPPALVVASTATPTTAAPAAAAGGTSFAFCVAIKPGAYMDAPGAMFLSVVSAVDKQGYSAMAAQAGFGSRVSAQYGVSVGSSSCTSYPDRATAQARWQEQHDSFGMKFYKKVATGMPATP